MNAINQNENVELNRNVTQLIDVNRIKMSNTTETSIGQAKNFRATMQNTKFSFVDSLLDVINREFFLKN
jgi:hypothetical protein